LINDLTVFLALYGGRIGEDGNLTGIQPMPKGVMTFFGMGYDSGRLAELNRQK
jgi:hypothetical protein